MLMTSLYCLIFIFLSLTSFLLSLYFLNMDLEIYIEWDLISLNSSTICMFILLDWVSLMFISFVFYITAMVIKYSEEYMASDKNLKRFLWLMIMFVISMMMMILSPSLISILLGWDGLGLVSYVLVIYYQNVKSYNAGMLTALSNRIGDAALLMSIACMSLYGSWNVVNYLDFMKESFSMKVVLWFIILAAITKSAQIPFSAWLPAAMAAPTPVSSLVHSSTLVTAGVYLLFRCSSGFSQDMLSMLLYLSLFTMFMAGLGANFEFDLKKIIALSTLSQLGMMLTILSLGEKELAFFHLLIHALFKALLFMCAGAIIHNMGNCQDIRYMGGLVHFMPLTSACMNVSNFALCGLPFMSGFYSKDLMAEVLSMKSISIFVYIIFFASIGLTVSYTMRLSFYLFLGDFNSHSLNYLSDNNNKIMLKSMMGLVFLVIFMGSILNWLLFPTPKFIMLPIEMKLMTMFMILIGAIMGYLLFKSKISKDSKSLKFYYLSMFLSNMWNMPILSVNLNSYILGVGKTYYKTMDQGWFEYYGSKNLFKLIKNYSQFLQLFSRNHLKSYLFIISLIMFVFIFFI
uniref:NADH-ubiquinone oxidoreductase chain 5 n=1 Tax=Alcidodes juglans TaxID=2530216 RepID=A0A482DV09_9CUCU|nr:NADH dehydrogenase subunit 5 [Alcidodes juglans]QBM10385.1 NADH dehydrogenase subunit 5 [Alcidodes juglans]